MKKVALLISIAIVLIATSAQAQLKIPANMTYTFSQSKMDSIVNAIAINSKYLFDKDSQFKVGDANTINTAFTLLQQDINRQLLSAFGDAYIKKKNITKDIEESKKAYLSGIMQQAGKTPNYTGPKQDDYKAGLTDVHPTTTGL